MSRKRDQLPFQEKFDMKNLFQKIKQVPDWVQGFAGFIGALVGIVVIFRENFRLVVVMLIILVFVSTMIVCATLIFSKKKSASAGDHYVPRYPRHRRKGMFGLVAATLIMISMFAVAPARSFIFSPFLEPKAEHIDIIIGAFKLENSLGEIKISNRLKDALQKRLRELGGTLVVKDLDQELDDEQEAKDVAAKHEAKAVIWGWVDAGGISISVLFTSANPESIATQDLNWSIAGADKFEMTLQFIREKLNENIAFISMYVIGSHFYQQNQFEKGAAAFDEAVKAIPDEVPPAAEALIHFFRARELHFSRSTWAKEKWKKRDSLNQLVICGYTKAIELKPDLSMAYNNLGVFIAGDYIDNMIGYDDDLMGLLDGNECLTKAGLEVTNIGSFFDKARELDPEIAAYTSNKWCLYWQINATKLMKIQDHGLHLIKDELLNNLEAIDDETIPAAQLLLGLLYFDQGDLNTALARFKQTDKLIPGRAEIKFNIAQTYRRLEKNDEALSLYRQLTKQPETSIEAHMAMAALYIEKKDLTNGLRHISHADSINKLQAFTNAENGEIYYRKIPTDILLSEIFYRQGDTKKAIEILEKAYTTPPVFAEGEMDAPFVEEDSNSWKTQFDFRVCLLKGMGALSNASDPFPWMPIDVETFESYDMVFSYLSDDTDGLAMNDIAATCNAKTNPMAIINGTCLGTNAAERLNKMYDVFRSWMPFRIFYRAQLPLDGLACPYLYSRSDDGQVWSFETTVITGHNGAQSKAQSTNDLKRFSGSLLIREVEPETSYIDYLRVRLLYPGNRIVELIPDDLRLSGTDNHYLQLHQGHSVVIHFKDYDKSFLKASVVCDGYYVRHDASVRTGLSLLKTGELP